MKSYISFLLLTVTPMIGSQALSQEAPSPPFFIADMEGAVFEGVLAGLPAWTAPDQGFTFFEAPDGQTIIAGFALDKDGLDAFRSPDDQEQLATEQPAGLVSDAVEGVIPKDIFTAEEEAIILSSLMTSIETAKTPEEYADAVDLWRQDLGARIAQKAEILSLMAPVPAITPAITLLPPPPVEVTELEPSASPVDIQTLSKGVPDADQDLALFSDIEEGFWFTVGPNSDAPILYALIDPECPYCAAAMITLREVVERGDIQLRVLLAPLVSDQSAARIAGILMPETGSVADAYWAHEIEKGLQGRSTLPLGDPKLLDEGMVSGVSYNIDIIRNSRDGRSISGVPFFAWMTPEGPSFHEGAPSSVSDLTGLLP